jgi:hypothetical protein
VKEEQTLPAPSCTTKTIYLTIDQQQKGEIMKRFINLFIGLVIMLGVFAPVTANGGPITLWAQLPGGDFGTVSFVGNWIMADDFEFMVAATIGQVEFWSTTPGPVEVHVEFYANTTDGSGYAIPGGAALYSDISTSTGTLEDISVCSQTHCTYRHTLVLDTPLLLEPGHYWVSIYGTTELVLSFDANVTLNSMARWYLGSWSSANRNLAFRLLEAPRICPISVEVTNTANAGAGSLRQALVDVCAGGTITFNASLSGAEIALDPGEQLTLANNVTIDGSALLTRVKVTAVFAGRVFWVNPGVTAMLNGLRISNGYTAGNGAGIYNQGSLAVYNSLFFNNDVLGDGGAIYNTGSLLLVNSTLDQNNAGGCGAAIYNTGNVEVTNSSINENIAFFGGGIYNNGGTLTVNNTSINGNNAGITGGGLYNVSSVTVTVRNSTLAGNFASAGAGIHNESGSMTVTGSTLSQNYTNDPNGNGGGILNGPGAVMTVANTTLAGNIADYLGGGIYNRGTLTLKNSTLSGNSASASNGGGLANYAGTLHMANTIIANSTSGGDCISVSGATIPANLNNLVEDGSCTASLSGDPMLAALADNGGPTWTMALLEGSPAIDAGDDATCAAAPVSGKDQRGVTRPQGAHCDIGAYEKIQVTIYLPMIFR